MTDWHTQGTRAAKIRYYIASWTGATGPHRAGSRDCLSVQCTSTNLSVCTSKCMYICTSVCISMAAVLMLGGAVYAKSRTNWITHGYCIFTLTQKWRHHSTYRYSMEHSVHSTDTPLSHELLCITVYYCVLLLLPDLSLPTVLPWRWFVVVGAEAIHHHILWRRKFSSESSSESSTVLHSHSITKLTKKQ